MIQHPTTVFAFSEADHLTRIHLKLALENVGFAVEESADELRVAGEATSQPPAPRLGDR